MRREYLLVLVLMAADVGAVTVTVRAQSPADQATAAFHDDVHAAAGLTCASCHGASKSGAGGAAAYAPIKRTAIAAMCAKCHADAVYMKKFAPQVRVDQYAQYLTSMHGQQMAKGEDRVATCSDCHQAHGILPVRDARSPVAPPHVETTCAKCHSDPVRMKPFGKSPEIPSDWEHSVHAEALLKRGDTSAPTCNTCHGSHGATPPGIDAVANVCAQCHVREADLFRASRKREIFQMIGAADCLVCHSNHRILHPQDSWIGLDPPALCSSCHKEGTDSAKTIRGVQAGFATLTRKQDAAKSVLDRATQAGMLVDDGAMALRAANEAHVRLRVLVHTFAEPPFDDALKPGIASADKAQAVGDAALAELRFRRQGLAVATLVILGFLATLFVKIRRLPPIE
jgi:predicted CXXCH cytochrome family protein